MAVLLPPPASARSGRRPGAGTGAPPAGFTMLEVCLAMVVLVVMLAVAVPSVRGVLAERRLRASYEALDRVVAQAQQQSIRQGRPTLLLWSRDGRSVRLCAADLPPVQRAKLEPVFAVQTGQYALEMAAAARGKGVRADEWTFWPTGCCEPALVRYEGPAGQWEARYNPLTAQAVLGRFVAR